MSDKPDKPQLPQCHRTYRRDDGANRRCQRGGYACWVVGEFGREAKVLCGPCFTALRALGWKVSFQIEGDSAAALLTPAEQREESRTDEDINSHSH